MEHSGPLAGIRILDLADENAAFCSKVLADLGASVLKVEKPGGDKTQGTSRHIYHNSNKRSITLNIEKAKGRELLFRLSSKADVIVESFTPGYLESIGCSYEVLSQGNPELIMASVTGFGQNGPRSGYKSNDLVAAAYGGQMHVTGEASSFPLALHGGQSAYVASLFAAIGVLLAVIRRRQTGKGEHLDISAQEAAAGTLDHVLVRYLYDGVIPVRQGDLAWNRSSFILPCRDGRIFISIANQWETLVEWVASEGMAQDLTDEKWRDEKYRFEHIDHIREVLQQWTMTHKVEELFEIAQAMRFPWAPVSRPEDVLTSPQLEAREFFGRVIHSENSSTMVVPGMPYKFSGGTRHSPASYAPVPGKDNRSVYCGELGLSEEEVAELHRSGVI
jgi:crotonobetainyl-CoA:carnitine CoA-transferase CaiB-like acyl-CoA transferase